MSAGKHYINKPLFALIKRLRAIKKTAEKLGIFTENRTLIECPKCGLTEDIDSYGRLFTAFKDSDKTNLQFKKLKGRKNHFRCPNCGKILKAVYE